MSRVRNADEFQQRFRKLRDDYERRFGPRVANVRQEYAGNSAGQVPPVTVDECLEFHIRAYVVNGMLAALNWRLDTSLEDGLPNLIPEAPVRSLERGTTRFLDYLGLERDTGRPLLVVETKRPKALFPQLAVLPDSSLALTLPEIVSRGLSGESLMGEWSKWITDLRDYVRSVYTQVNKCPKRVVLTNGKWLILFLDPSDAFFDGGTKDPNLILVFEDWSDIKMRYAELFRYLEHSAVLGEIGALLPSELPFYIGAEMVDRLIHGLHLRYIEQPGIYQPSPVIKVAPVIFLHLQYDTWLRVESPPNEYQVPHETNKLSQHLDEVRNAAEQLLQQVNSSLGASFLPSPLAAHYCIEDDFEQMPGVKEVVENDFLVVTGDKKHYLMSQPSISNCPYHDWARCQTAGVPSNPGPITVRSIEPRSFFVSTEVHHCTHRDVVISKASPITTENLARCGLRSGQEGQAFCEIWRFESYLCCRACVFGEICTIAPVFRLPCQDQTEVHAGLSWTSP